MRRVDRDQVPVPAVLSEPNRRGPRETARAKAAYTRWREELQAFENRPASERSANDKPPQFKFKFEAYKDDEVKAALVMLFKGKCAYCESRYAGTQPMDVEHWRPKGMAIRADGSEMKPGYYWLAADWNNLLPSCIDCNRARRQELPDGTVLVIGKENHFPVLDEAERQLDHTETAKQERPTILDPCDDEDPGRHLRFDEDAVALPVADSVLGSNSIRVFALNRMDLVLDRRHVLRQIAHRAETVRLLMSLLDELADGDTLRDLVLDVMSHEIAAMEGFADEDAPFSAMARAAIDRVRAELGV